MAQTVLVVEDEVKIRELLRSYLERAGLDVLTTGRQWSRHVVRVRARSTGPAGRTGRLGAEGPRSARASLGCLPTEACRPQQRSRPSSTATSSKPPVWSSGWAAVRHAGLAGGKESLPNGSNSRHAKGIPCGKPPTCAPGRTRTCDLEIVRGCRRSPLTNAGQCRRAAQTCPVVVVCRWGSPPDSVG